MTLEGEVVHYKGMHISFNAMPDPEMDRLPPDVRDQIEETYSLIRSAPSTGLKEVERLLIDHPKLLCLHNWRICCLQLLDLDELAGNAIIDLHQAHPEYFFARVMRVDQLLQERDVEGAEQTLFEFGDTLSANAPGGIEVHITEFRQWHYAVGKLRCAQNDLERAKEHLDDLNAVDPNSAEVDELDNAIYLTELSVKLANFAKNNS